MREISAKKQAINEHDLVQGIICGLVLRGRKAFSAETDILIECFQAILPKVDEQALEENVRMLYAIKREGHSVSLEVAILGLLTSSFITVDMPRGDVMRFQFGKDFATYYLTQLPFEQEFWLELTDDFLRAYHHEPA